MRLRTQLFIGMALLAAALLLTQAALQRRQLAAWEAELGQVATRVGRFLIETQVGVADVTVATHTSTTPAAHLPISGDAPPPAAPPRPPGAPSTPPEIRREVETRIVVLKDDAEGPPRWEELTHDVKGPGGVLEALDVRIERPDAQGAGALVVSGLPGGTQTLALDAPTDGPTLAGVMRQGLLTTGVLLLLGLVGAALFADRVSRPLLALSRAADALGEGSLSTRVPALGGGELGDLERAFNRMAARLEALEGERARWRAREHLAELGDLSRGLAHTLRNPLHTLGLMVEEIAARPDDAEALVPEARAQIRRIDLWMRSFLALGSGADVVREDVFLPGLLEDLALECASSGHPVELDPDPPMLTVPAVRPALKAALANLVTNAVQASPAGAEAVRVRLGREGDAAVIEITDRGPGLPEAVRARLFTPHTTTREAGSGMGIYLARQLVEGGHGGQLTLSPRPGGGTLARVTLPLPPEVPHG